MCGSAKEHEGAEHHNQPIERQLFLFPYEPEQRHRDRVIGEDNQQVRDNVKSEKVVPPEIAMPMRHEIRLKEALQEFAETGRGIYIEITHPSLSPPPPAANAAEARSRFAR